MILIRLWKTKNYINLLILFIGLTNFSISTWLIAMDYEFQNEKANKQLTKCMSKNKNELQWCHAVNQAKKSIIKGANPNPLENNPLTQATIRGHYLFVEWLLNHGSNPYVELADLDYCNPLEFLITMPLGYEKPADQRIAELLYAWMQKPEIIQEYEGMVTLENDLC